jgi:predicted sugar kinase
LYDNYVTGAAASKVLSYMLDKYAHMQGRWFVKSINAQEGNTLEVVDKLPTWAGVGAAVKASKAAAEGIRKATNLVAEPMAELVTDLIGQMYNKAEQTILVSEPDIFT